MTPLADCALLHFAYERGMPVVHSYFNRREATPQLSTRTQIG